MNKDATSPEKSHNYSLPVVAACRQVKLGVPHA